MGDRLYELNDARSLALHRAVGEAIRADPGIVVRARERVRQWLATGSTARPLALQWQQHLDGPLEDLLAFLVEDSERAQQLRSASPFAGALTPRARWAVWRSVKRP